MDRALPFNYALEFALQLRKITENLSPSSRKMLDTVHPVDLIALFMGSLGWPADIQSLSAKASGALGHPSVGASVFQVARNSYL